MRLPLNRLVFSDVLARNSIISGAMISGSAAAMISGSAAAMISGFAAAMISGSAAAM